MPWLTVYETQIYTLIALLSNQAFRNDLTAQSYVCERIGEILRWVDLYGPHRNVREANEDREYLDKYPWTRKDE